MRSVIEKSTNVSVHLMNAEQTVTLTAEGLTCDDLPLNDGYTTEWYELVDVENVPGDWRGRKYVYNAGEWTPNPADTE